MNEMIPFGKYNGQPIQKLSDDPEYCDWLVAQEWFRERYREIYSFIINNCNQPVDTPEHNKLQVKFLDDSFCAAFSLTVNRKLRELWFEKGFSSFTIEKREFEPQGGNDVIFLIQIKPPGTDADDCSCGFNGRIYFGPSTVCGCRATFKCSVEIKPSVGDDFPSVLRQVKKSNPWGQRCLFLEKFSAEGASFHQVVDIFRESSIAVSTLETVQIMKSKMILESL